MDAARMLSEDLITSLFSLGTCYSSGLQGFEEGPGQGCYTLYSRSPDQIVEYANPVSRRSQQQPSHLQPQRSQLPSQGAEKVLHQGRATRLGIQARSRWSARWGERSRRTPFSTQAQVLRAWGTLNNCEAPPQDCQNLLVTHHSTNSYAVPTVCQHCSRAWDGSLNKTNKHISPPRSSF